MLFSPRGFSLALEEVVPNTSFIVLFMVTGNIINSFMEEGLFRGVMLSSASK